MDNDDHHHNFKRSYTEMADAAANSPFSNPHISSLDHSLRLPQQQPQPQPQSSLPQKVEQLLGEICEVKNLPQPDADVRRRLGLLSEDKALELLGKIYSHPIEIRTLGGFIVSLLRKPKYKLTSPSHSPSKSASPITPVRLQGEIFTSPSHSPSKFASQITPVRLKDQHVRPSSSASPSKFARISLSQGPSSVPPRRGVSMRLFDSLQPLPPSQGEILALPSQVVEQPADNGQELLEALGELEFRRQFLILNYAGERGLKSENGISPETIRSWKDLPMQQFEIKVWEALGRRYIDRADRRVTFDWDSGKAYVYQCEVSVDGSYKLKGPYLNNPKRTLLHKELGDDKVIMVKFAALKKEKGPTGSWNYDFTNYSKVSREGIVVGLRKYRFFVFKEGGNKEKKKTPTSSHVKCYFICVDKSVDKSIHDIRCRFMHPHTVSSVSNYMARFSLILSKTESLIVNNWSLVKVEDIDDVYCLDEAGNRIYKQDGKPLLHTDGTGFISEDLASLCPKEFLKGNSITKENIEPLLIQFRLFDKGLAVKGTFLVNKMLPPNTIQIRPSMVKVQRDPKLPDDQTLNSLEIVGVSKSRKNAHFSRNLIALLCYGGVPEEYFMEMLMKDLKDSHGVFCNRRAASRVAFNRGGMDDDYTSLKMILSGIPLEESYLQHQLSFLAKEEKNSLRRGKISSPQSWMLMGTTDPTGILEKDEVCIILDNGQMSGKVLVYRHPGLHFGDIHVLKATCVEDLEHIVGNAKYAIFFSSKGPRSVADEMGGGDFDGDLYWVSINPKLLECFKPSEPWIETSATSAASEVENVRKPSELLPNDIEDALINLFLTTRFDPSYSMSEASDNWVALMDQLLTLADDSSDEKPFVKKDMERLVDLYYNALDAPKKGKKVEIPAELKPPAFPHYMGKQNSYTSTSILGKLYDTVSEYEEDVSNKEITKLAIFDVELPHQYLTTWKERYQEYRGEMYSALPFDDKEGRNQACDLINKKYKKLLYSSEAFECEEFEESRRSNNEIFSDALAIYNVVYDHAISVRDVRKCGFVWKVAGPALCIYYLNNSGDRSFRVAHSFFKDFFN